MARSKATEVVQEVEAAVDIVEAADQAIAPFLMGETYDQERLIQEVEFFHRQHMHSAFEVGRRLIVLKASIPYGQFGSQVAERLSISPGHASRLMSFARHIVELGKKSNGMLDYNKLKSMDHEKVILLGELAEESPEELAETGTIGGRTLDEWDAKSRKDLADTVRKQQAIIDKGHKQIQDKNERLEQKQKQIDSLLAADSNSVVIASGLVIEKMREALDAFSRLTENVADEDLSPGAENSVVGLRSELRKYYDVMVTLLDKRFPDALEVPSDMDLTLPAPPKGKAAKASAKVIDAN